MVDKKRALSRGKWMNEEVAEFLVAEDIYEQADAMIDLIYFALGTLVEMGLEADELFDIVQQANMSKLWPDGKPHYNPKDGKDLDKRYIVEKLEKMIISGGMEPLTRMPSVRSLAMELSVNPNTIQRAYTQLEQDGYLYTVSGRGSYVTAENEWRENKQSKVLKEWQDITRQAKEAGVAEERLAEYLHQIYEEAHTP